MRRIGHRGAMGYAPENTIAAFQKAIDLGCDEAETDVWLAGDGRLLVSHGAPNGRTALLLDEVLDFCRGRLTVNIEVKSESDGAAARGAGAYLARHLAGRSGDDVYVSSFRLSALEGARGASAGLRLAYVFALPVERRSLIDAARDLGLGQLHPERRVVAPDLIESAHGAGLRLHVWTVNEPEEITRLHAWGVDGIISDYPDRVPRGVPVTP